MKKVMPKSGFPWWKYIFFFTVVVATIGGVVYYFIIGPRERQQDLKNRFAGRVWSGSASKYFKDMSPGIGVVVPTTIKINNLRLNFSSPEMTKYINGIVTNAVPVIGDGVYTSGSQLSGGVSGEVTNDPITYTIEGYLDMQDQEIFLGVHPDTNHEVILRWIIPGDPPWIWETNDTLSSFVLVGSIPVQISGDWQTITFSDTVNSNHTTTGSLTSN